MNTILGTRETKDTLDKHLIPKKPTGPGLLVQAGRWDSLCGPERESARDHTQTCPMGPSDGVAGGTP